MAIGSVRADVLLCLGLVKGGRLLAELSLFIMQIDK